MAEGSMLSDHNTNWGNAEFSPMKFNAGKLGLFLLSTSFLIWAVIIASGSMTGFSYAFVMSAAMNWFGLSTIALTIVGLVLANIGMRQLSIGRTSFSRYSTFFYAWINIIGFYLLYNSVWGGPVLQPSQTGLFTLCTGAIFIFYIILFALFLIPFLPKGMLASLTVPVALNAIFIVSVLGESYRSYAQLPGNYMPGANFPYIIQLVNPSFGFPWFQMNFAAIQNISPWIYALPVASNLMFSALYFITILGNGIRKKVE